MTRLGMVVDLGACMGCRACMEACKVENNTGQAVFWMHVFRYEDGSYPESSMKFLPRPCQHCTNAPCVKVCPVGARFKREDGLTLTDFERCIGCRYCSVACPYGVNYFNWKKPEDRQYLDWKAADVAPIVAGVSPPYKNPDLAKEYDGRLVAGSGHFKGTMEKCTFCAHRLAKGLDPACVANCPVRALHFGDFEDPKSDVSLLVARNTSFRLLEDAGTEPNVRYIHGTPPQPGQRPAEAPRGRL